MTAHVGLVSRAKLKAGETLFVNGGTGGVGSSVVQMAKIIGATNRKYFQINSACITLAKMNSAMIGRTR